MKSSYTKAMDSLVLSEREKAKMVSELAERAILAHDSPTGHSKPAMVAGGRARRRTARRFAAAAAIVALAVCGTAYALSGFVGLGQFVEHLFGASDAAEQVVERVGRPVGASATDNGVTVSADAIVGDASNFAVVFSVARDDGEPLAGVEPLEDGILPLSFGEDLHVEFGSPSPWGGYGSSYFYDADPDDNAIQLVEMRSVQSEDAGASLVGGTLTASFEDLTYYPADGDPVVIAPGSWELSFPLDYEDTSVELPSGQAFSLDGMEATISRLLISPVGMRVSYRVKVDGDWETREDDGASSGEAGLADRLLAPDVSLNMADGTSVPVATDGGGRLDEDGGVACCEKGLFFDRIVDLAEVESVSVGGATVEVRI